MPLAPPAPVPIAAAEAVPPAVADAAVPAVTAAPTFIPTTTAAATPTTPAAAMPAIVTLRNTALSPGEKSWTVSVGEVDRLRLAEPDALPDPVAKTVKEAVRDTALVTECVADAADRVASADNEPPERDADDE